jgi:hypothetical protein
MQTNSYSAQQNPYQVPNGYNQIQPNLDQPHQHPPQPQQQPIQQQPTGAPNYPVDPGMTLWRTNSGKQNLLNLQQQGQQHAMTQHLPGGQNDLQQLLTSGLSNDDAAKRFNEQFHRTTGNEATTYADGSLSIPEGYFYPDGPNGELQWHPRNQSGGGHPPPQQQQQNGPLNNTNPALLQAVLYGNSQQASPYIQRLLQGQSSF